MDLPESLSLSFRRPVSQTRSLAIPEASSALLGFTSACVFAPLGPERTEAELALAFEDLPAHKEQEFAGYEVINLTGENGLPFAIDEALRMCISERWPAVRDLLIFAVPHAQLGEVVGAALTVAPGAERPSLALVRTLLRRKFSLKWCPEVLVFFPADTAETPAAAMPAHAPEAEAGAALAAGATVDARPQSLARGTSSLSGELGSCGTVPPHTPRAPSGESSPHLNGCSGGLPKGRTGKPARIGLAERLGLPLISAERYSPDTWEVVGGSAGASGPIAARPYFPELPLWQQAAPPNTVAEHWAMVDRPGSLGGWLDGLLDGGMPIGSPPSLIGSPLTGRNATTGALRRAPVVSSRSEPCMPWAPSVGQEANLESFSSGLGALPPSPGGNRRSGLSPAFGRSSPTRSAGDSPVHRTNQTYDALFRPGFNTKLKLGEAYDVSIGPLFAASCGNSTPSSSSCWNSTASSVRTSVFNSAVASPGGSPLGPRFGRSSATWRTPFAAAFSVGGGAPTSPA